MPVVSTMMQFLIGLGLGAVSTIAPWALRPFVITALVLGALQALLLYHAGGEGAVEIAASILMLALKDVSTALIGIGLGRVLAAIVFSER